MAASQGRLHVRDGAIARDGATQRMARGQEAKSHANELPYSFAILTGRRDALARFFYGHGWPVCRKMQEQFSGYGHGWPVCRKMQEQFSGYDGHGWHIHAIPGDQKLRLHFRRTGTCRSCPDHISSPQTLRQDKIAAFSRDHPIAMRTALAYSLLLIGLACCSQALASAGATAAGVTTSGGGGNNNGPSSDVTDQSSGFVQQNQQLQNAQAPNGMALPFGATGAQGAPTSAGNTAAGNSAAGTAGKDPGASRDTPSADTAAPAVSAPPPAPPPIYQSAIKHLDRRTGSTATAATMSEPAAEPVVAKPPPKPASLQAPPPAPKPPAASNTSRETARSVDKTAERSPAPLAVTGGRGVAPDGYAFYSGLTLASALLAFGLFTFLRIGHDETQ